MWFVDQAQIQVKAGDGGRGCVAFSQPPYTRTPFPDGGDGGDGGDVVLRTDPNVATLLDFQFRHEFKGQRGWHGGSNKKTGACGESRVVRVPVGTVIVNADTEELLRDLAQPGEEIIVAKGGRGGIGNGTHPTSATARGAGKRRGAVRTDAQLMAMRAAAQGKSGETRALRLELKLIADVGLIGLPNAGKSSLLARISTARPKVAPYPFTTRYPVLGVVQAGERGTFVACDIPGLIEGAHAGRGLGFQFLRHIERTRLLAHVVDIAPMDGRDPWEAYQQVNEELRQYSTALGERPQVIVANKMDLPEAPARLRAFEASLRQAGDTRRIVAVSCATGEDLPALIEALWDALTRLAAPTSAVAQA